MSRFTDMLERDLEVIADRATPSPDAWESIRARIDEQEPIQETEIVMLTENTLTSRRWPLVAAAAAAVALAIGAIALVNRGDTEELPADPPQPTVAPAPEPETGADEQGSALETPAAGDALPPGTYRTDKFGVPIAFEVPETASQWSVQVDDDIALTVGPEGAFVNISRVGSFYDAEQALAPWPSPDAPGTGPGVGSFGALDIDAWIEANGVVVEEQGETTVGGRTATYRRVLAPAGAVGGCPEGLQPCLAATSASADLQDVWSGPSTVVYGELPFTFWVVELADFEPIMVWAGFPTPTEWPDPQSWFDDVQHLVDSIVLGDPAPAVDGGAARLSTFAAGAGDAGELPEAGAQVESGTYATDAIGVPLTFDVQDGQTGPWTLVSNDQTGIQLISDETGREFMAIGRVGSWFDAVESRTEDTRGLGSIPADQMDTWIAVNDVIVVDSAEVQVGGRDASYRLIRLDTTPGATADFCPPGEAPCLWAASGSADLVDADSTPVPFGRDRVQAIWSVDMGEFEPVFIFAAANLDDDGPWFTDTVQPIVDSIVLGEPAPVIPGGTARIPERVTVTATMTVNQTGERDIDNPWPVERTGRLTGDITGTYTGTGTSSPNGAEVTLDWTLDATIEGLGSGTLTIRSHWVNAMDGATRTTDHVIGGTGDLAGVTGFGTGVQTSDFRFGVEYTADIALMLAPPT